MTDSTQQQPTPAIPAEAVEAFLKARITEDEEIAQGSDFLPGEPWRHDPECSKVWDGTGAAAANDVRPHRNSRTGEHIARHNPNRVLAECAAKRAIIATGNATAIKSLASIYNDHPDYRQEWAL